MILALLVAALAAEPPPLEVALRGYVDVGWFDVFGDGPSYVSLPGAATPRGFAPAAWVFVGDPWANPVNSQGDSADLGESPIPRVDPIHSEGRPTFLVNTVHADLTVRRGNLGLRTRLAFEPRSGTLGALGDRFDVDLATLTWTPSPRLPLTVSAGKIESPFGVEWWARHAPDRFGITPSIIARYTVGTPVGVMASVAPTRHVDVAVAVTNGSTTTERWGHFADELDRNGVPTGIARVGVEAGRRVRGRAGVSVSVGPQDGQPRADVLACQLGVDARVMTPVVTVQAEFLTAHHDDGCLAVERPALADVAPDTDRLRARGGYLEADVRLPHRIGVVGRVDWRDAVLWTRLGNVYDTDTLRLTLGALWVATPELTLKAEFLHLAELNAPAATGDLPDDVLTLSAVYAFGPLVWSSP